MAMNRKFARLLAILAIVLIMCILFVDMPSLKERYTKYGSKGVEIISQKILPRYIQTTYFEREKTIVEQKIAVGRLLRKNASQRNSGPMPDTMKLEEEINVTHKTRDTKTNNKHKEELLPGMIPSQAIYLWCGIRWFEFKHYVSVLSMIKTMNPHKIYFYYEYPPPVDRFYYHQWLEDLIHDHPFFIYLQMPPYLKRFCSADTNTKVDMILKLLDVEGALYMSENTWMLDFKHEMLLKDFVYALKPGSTDGFILMRGGILGNNTAQKLLQEPKYNSQRLSCGSVKSVYENVLHPLCIDVKGGRFETFKPMDIWDLDDPFGRLSRKLYYGTEEILKPKPSFDTLVPNIGHMVWIGGGEMDFVFYLSALSVLYVVNVEVLYIHGDLEPKGEYWKKLKNNNRVKFVTRLPVYQVYQGEIPEHFYRALMSDIIRVDLMINYGGIYTDTDAIWVKPLTLRDRGYDAVASYDWVDWSFPFPDTVNFGISYGKRNAPFWRIFRESMRVLHNEVHGFTGVMNPYKLLERYPHLLRIDRRLSVICYQFRCHPLWVPDYHNMTKDHITMNSIKNWREDVHAFHWTHPNPPEYQNISTLLQSTSMFAEIGKNVLKKAGII